MEKKNGSKFQVISYKAKMQKRKKQSLEELLTKLKNQVSENQEQLSSKIKQVLQTKPVEIGQTPKKSDQSPLVNPLLVSEHNSDDRPVTAQNESQSDQPMDTHLFLKIVLSEVNVWF